MLLLFQHPNWNGDIMQGNDVGLVYIEEAMDIEGNGFAAVIQMAEEDSDWMGAECVITGWGNTIFGKQVTVLVPKRHQPTS